MYNGTITNKINLLLPPISLVLIVLQCGINSPIDSDISNENKSVSAKIIGMIYCKNEYRGQEQCEYTGASGVKITLQSHYLPFHHPNDTLKDIRHSEYNRSIFTDAHGYYELDLPIGIYRCEAYDENDNRILIGNIPSVDGGPLICIMSIDADLRFNDTLRSASTIRGRIASIGDCNEIVIRLPALNQETSVDTDGYFIFTQIPAEKYALEIASHFGNIEFHDTLKNIALKQGEATYIDLPNFHSRRIVYNANLGVSGKPPVDENIYHLGDTCRIGTNTGNMKRYGFDFIGWNTAHDGSGVFYEPGSYFHSFNIDTTILYAHWKPQGMVLIPAKEHTFIMGDSKGVKNKAPDEIPEHPVRLSADFWMDSTEITQQQYTMVMKAIYPKFQHTHWNEEEGLGDYFPANYINWYDAALFCNARTKVSGSTDTVYSYSLLLGNPGDSCRLTGVSIDLHKRGFHLPTEAQWEFACRGNTTTYCYFDMQNVDDYAWYKGNSDGTIHPVAQKLKNGFNLYDMSGNVWEWCTDARFPYDEDNRNLIIDPVTLYPVTLSQNRILRGGSKNEVADLLKSAYRGDNKPYYFKSHIGFRTCFTVR